MSKKVLIVVQLLSVLFWSCHVSKHSQPGTNSMIEVRAQDSAFLDSKYIDLSFWSDWGMNHQTVFLKKDSSIRLNVELPPIISLEGISYIVFPGQKISVALDSNSQRVLTANNKVEHDQLLFLKDLETAQSGINYYPINDSLFKTKSIKSQIFELKQNREKIGNRKLQILDSLVIVNKITNEVKDVAINKVNISWINELLSFYMFNMDKLKKENLFPGVYFDLMEDINSLNPKQVYYGYNYAIEEIANKILPISISGLSNKAELNTLFDSTVKHFRGVAKDFLLTKIMITTYKKRIEIPQLYTAKYNTTCETEEYKRLFKKIAISTATKKQLATKNGFQLISLDNDNYKDIDDLISGNIGKTILLSFWATWCVPCLKEFPFLDSLEKKTPGMKLIYISIDKNQDLWQNYILKRQRSTSNNYWIGDSPGQAAFFKKYNISTIPRNMLFDQKGKIIYDDFSLSDSTKLEQIPR